MHFAVRTRTRSCLIVSVRRWRHRLSLSYQASRIIKMTTYLFAFSCMELVVPPGGLARYLHAKQVRPLSLEGVSYFWKGEKVVLFHVDRLEVGKVSLDGDLVFRGWKCDTLHQEQLMKSEIREPLYFFRTTIPCINLRSKNTLFLL